MELVVTWFNRLCVMCMVLVPVLTWFELYPQPIVFVYALFIYIYIYIQFICILESQVVECSMESFYTQRF